MRKFIFSVVIAIMTVLSINAQTAIETPKLFDNVYVGINGGVTTPLDFDNVFPVNPVVGVTVGKWFTPIFGAEIDGNAWLGSHASYGMNDRVNFTPIVKNDGSVSMSYNTFRGMYLGTNGLVNLTNLFKGYNGKPRGFEVTALAGIGWIHGFRPNMTDEYNNHIGVKTGLNLDFNLGKTKAHTLSLKPAVLWNICQPGNSGGKHAFNSKGAQLYLGLGYTYHFKNSNGTHAFKLYNVGAMNDEINNLRADLKKKPKEVVKEVKVFDRRMVPIEKTYVVQFAKNSALLTGENMELLNKIPAGTKVAVVGTASIEGSKSHNDELSEARANAVTTYLKDRHVIVVSSKGIGSSNGPTSNRLVIVTLIR